MSVFNAQMTFEGNFGNLDFSKSDIKPEHIIWEKATIMIKTTNLKSIKNQVNININNQKYGFEPVRISDNSNYEILETNQINLKETNIKNFNAKLSPHSCHLWSIVNYRNNIIVIRNVIPEYFFFYN